MPPIDGDRQLRSAVIQRSGGGPEAARRDPSGVGHRRPRWAATERRARTTAAVAATAAPSATRGDSRRVRLRRAPGSPTRAAIASRSDSGGGSFTAIWTASTARRWRARSRRASGEAATRASTAARRSAGRVPSARAEAPPSPGRSVERARSSFVVSSRSGLGGPRTHRHPVPGFPLPARHRRPGEPSRQVGSEEQAAAPSARLRAAGFERVTHPQDGIGRRLGRFGHRQRLGELACFLIGHLLTYLSW